MTTAKITDPVQQSRPEKQLKGDEHGEYLH